MEKIPVPSLDRKGIEQALKKAISLFEFSSFEAGVSSEDSGQKREFLQAIVSFLESKGFERKETGYEMYLLLDVPSLSIEILPAPVFVGGFYTKLSRELPQTFHYCFNCRGRGCGYCGGTGKLSKESVQELAEKIFIPAFRADSSKFHGCGREDKDVRMLGKGRPFILEIVSPRKRRAKLAVLEKKFNSKFGEKAELHELRFALKEKVALLKTAEFMKIYYAECFCKKGVSQGELDSLRRGKIAVLQQTPVRVEKRRAMKEREKSAEILEASVLKENMFSLKILASHGLYIKEFISGDSKRTNPGISSLLEKPCSCESLDVLEIILPKGAELF